MDFLQIIECELKERNISARKMLLDLNFSNNLLTKWKKGIVPSMDKITAIANYLEVSVPYLLGDLPKGISKKTLPNIKNALLATPQRVCSLRSGISVSASERLKIGRYMNCSQDYLYGFDYGECEADNNTDFNETEVVFLICNILDQCASDESYKILQLQISRLIARNLNKNFKITYQVLLDKKGIDDSKLKLIFSSNDMSGYGFNFSDIMRIMDDFKILPPDMFKEKGNSPLAN